MMSSGKRKREDFGTQYKNGEFIPQQDGAGDAYSEALQVELYFLYLFWCKLSHIHRSSISFLIFHIVYFAYQWSFYQLLGFDGVCTCEVLEVEWLTVSLSLRLLWI